MPPCGVRDTEWCVRERGSSLFLRWDAVRRNTSGTIPSSFECDWNLLPTLRVAAVLACFHVMPSIVYCCRVLIVLMCALMIHSCIWGGNRFVW
jgi:hypothetical protein